MTTRNANLDKNLGSRNQYRADTRALGQIIYRLTGAFRATQKYLAGRGLLTPDLVSYSALFWMYIVILFY